MFKYDISIVADKADTVFIGHTPKGTEWLLKHLKQDRVLLTLHEIQVLRRAMEREGLSVETSLV